jgi:glucan phosphoethanolaminetransferase (alkaline phosphatase superfamily)
VSIWISIVATVLFGVVGISFFYSAFKTYKDDDDGEIEDFGVVGSIEFIAIFFVFVLWVCKKFFSQTHYILAFRTVSFLMGLMMIGIIILFWHYR